MTTQPKTTADVIISAIAEWKDSKIYWEDCTSIIKANLSALSSELSALQKENAELKEMCKVKDEALEEAKTMVEICLPMSHLYQPQEGSPADRINKALALQPEKVPQC